MDKAFGWIGEIFQTLLRLLPWLVIVPATHGGVAFVHGHRVKEWKPGLHWYWPVVTTYKLMATVRQTQMIQSKIVMTKDLQTVTSVPWSLTSWMTSWRRWRRSQTFPPTSWSDPKERYWPRSARELSRRSRPTAIGLQRSPDRAGGQSR